MKNAGNAWPKPNRTEWHFLADSSDSDFEEEVDEEGDDDDDSAVDTVVQSLCRGIDGGDAHAASKRAFIKYTVEAIRSDHPTATDEQVSLRVHAFVCGPVVGLEKDELAMPG